jgi:acetyl esterase/lipase
MHFVDLPPQPAIYPEEAAEYAAETLKRSSAAVSVCKRIAQQHYGPDYRQSLDIYLPTPTEALAPVLVFAHGGAWTNGYKEWMGLMAPALNEAGIVFVSVSYRLAPDCTWEAMVQDCISAIAWVGRNIRSFGGDPKRIAVGGHSAGGHLMALAALRQDLLLASGFDPSSITGVFPLCAPLDIRYPDKQPGSGEERTHRMILADVRDAAAASPICALKKGAPYFLLAYATDDLPRIIKSNQAMATQMALEQLSHHVMLLSGNHFSVALDVGQSQCAWTQEVIRQMKV